MTPAQAGVLLAKISAYDNRQPAAAMAAAWAEQLAATDLDDALDAVRRWFATPGQRWLMAADIAHLARDLRRDKAIASQTETGAHCGQAGCACTHDDGCERGWIELAKNRVQPCPVCRRGLHRRVASVPPSGQRGPGDLAALRTGKHQDDPR